MSTQVTRLKSGTLAAANESIELNDTQSEVEKAAYEYRTKLFALQQEFNGKQDSLRSEFHAKLAEITASE